MTLRKKTPTMSAAEWNASQQGKKKATPEKKVQSGKEQMDLSSSEVSKLIDSILLKVPEIVHYFPHKITVQHAGMEIDITFKIKKK